MELCKVCESSEDDASSSKERRGIDSDARKGVESRGLLRAGRFLQDKRRERGKRNRIKEAPVNSRTEQRQKRKEEAEFVLMEGRIE